jgi:hypothetical protein
MLSSPAAMPALLAAQKLAEAAQLFMMGYSALQGHHAQQQQQQQQGQKQ